jgi:hypothetical protein
VTVAQAPPQPQAQAPDEDAPEPEDAASPEDEQRTDEEPSPEEATAPEDVPEPEDVSKPGEELSEEEQQARLLDYLLSLTDELPKEKTEEFEDSGYRLRVESLRERLLGKRGLRAVAEEKRRNHHVQGGGAVSPEHGEREQGERDLGGERSASTITGQQGAELTISRLTGTFRYIQQMSVYHPDPAVREGLTRHVGRVIEDIQRAHGTRVEGGARRRGAPRRLGPYSNTERRGDEGRGHE